MKKLKLSGYYVFVWKHADSTMKISDRRHPKQIQPKTKNQKESHMHTSVLHFDTPEVELVRMFSLRQGHIIVCVWCVLALTHLTTKEIAFGKFGRPRNIQNQAVPMPDRVLTVQPRDAIGPENPKGFCSRRERKRAREHERWRHLAERYVGGERSTVKLGRAGVDSSNPFPRTWTGSKSEWQWRKCHGVCWRRGGADLTGGKEAGQPQREQFLSALTEQKKCFVPVVPNTIPNFQHSQETCKIANSDISNRTKP
jgi:hypothetical protein